MGTTNNRIMNWLRYSGFCIILQGNPLHWKVLPWFRREFNNEWPSPNERTWCASWMFLTVRVWIDNGEW
jgi:hypothetical protein